MLRNLVGIEVDICTSVFIAEGDILVARLGPSSFRVVSQKRATATQIVHALNEFIKEENVRNSRLNRNRGAHPAGQG